MNDETLSKKELAYALALRDLLPIEGVSRKLSWVNLRQMIREDYVRPSQWDRFNEVTERGS
jgi:hypothetical protein